MKLILLRNLSIMQIKTKKKVFHSLSVETTFLPFYFFATENLATVPDFAKYYQSLELQS